MITCTVTGESIPTVPSTHICNDELFVRVDPVCTHEAHATNIESACDVGAPSVLEARHECCSNYPIMDIPTWIIVGLVAGILASVVARTSFGIIGDIVVGIAGAFVGGWVFREMRWHAPMTGLAGVIFVAAIGAVVLLVLLRVISGARGRGRL